MPDFGGYLSDLAVSSDGSSVVGSSHIFGMAGSGDPTSLSWPDRVSGRAVYADDVSAGLSDSFPGAGVRSLVNVCTEGTELPSVTASGDLEAQACPAPNPGRDARLISDRGAAIQADVPGSTAMTTSLDGIVSEDGSRTFFMSPDPQTSITGFILEGGDGKTKCGQKVFDGGEKHLIGPLTQCPAQLYVRQRDDNGGVATRWISHAEEGLFGLQDASLTGQARFEGASADGDKVFFRTNSPLTMDDPNGGMPVPGGVTSGSASNNSWDLYMYDFPDEPGADPGDGELTRISAGPTGTGDGNGLQEANLGQAVMRFVSRNGQRVYFVTAAPLPGVPAPANGTITSPGGAATTASQANLYAYDHSRPLAERWQFVARLPRATQLAAATCATTGVEVDTPIVGAVGGTIGLISGRNCVRGSSDGTFITFWTEGRLTGDDPDNTTGDVYGYDVLTNRLTRISASEDGMVNSYVCINNPTTHCYGDGGFTVRTNINRAPLPSLGVATNPMEEGDQVAFFQSRSRLVAEDDDDAYDVYQWRNGELSLISTGASTTDGAFYLGNDQSGRNVYFATRDRLSWQDTDALLDAYTARVDGGIPEPVIPPACAVLADACQNAPAPAPTASGAASEVFAGAGNVTVGAGKPRRCAKGKVRRRGKCVKRAKAKKRAVRQGRRAGK